MGETTREDLRGGMEVDAGFEADEHGGEDEDEQRHRDHGEDGPDDEGVPFPGPEETGGVDGVVADGGEERLAMERHASGVEELVAHADEDEEEGDFKGIRQVRGELGGYEVEAKEAGDQEGDGCRRAEERVDADDEADRNAPGELARGGAAAQELGEGIDDAAVKEGGERICHRDRIDCAGGVCCYNTGPGGLICCVW